MKRPTIDIDSLSYKHRFDASSVLTAKGRKLLDGSVLAAKQKKRGRLYVAGETKGEFVDVERVLAAIAYFDMSMMLMRAFDPNYSTVANWKCNALRSIGQFQDAVTWYDEIIRIDTEKNGGSVSKDATTALAQKQAKKCRGKKNAALDVRVGDVDDFRAPPFTLYAQRCVMDMAAGKYRDAELYFADRVRKMYSAKALREQWSQLVGEADFSDLAICLQEHLFKWVGKKKGEMGWCYFSVSGPDVNEGVAFVVGRDKDGADEVCKVEFGRP